jgi:OHCU decarboxylase
VSETEEDLRRGLERLNALPEVEAANELLKCCGSIRWARRLAGERPFADFQQLLVKSDDIWLGLERPDWLEAFSSHPKIGEKKAVLAQYPEAQQWSETEQSGARAASREDLSELASLNRAYEKKFGHIFIICATGKSSQEMIASLRERLRNDAETEIRNAAEEQRKITHLRLGKLLSQESGV